MQILRKFDPCKIIVIGFLITILIGGFILWLPISHQEGVDVSLIDSYFITVSCICVTGLSTVDVANTFNLFGIFIMALLIQIGGLGVVCAGVSIILLAGQKIGIKERILIKDSFNLDSVKGIVKFILSIFKFTFIIELVGAIISFFAYLKYFSIKKALLISIFHSISAFNNAGFDLIGNYNSLFIFKDDVIINLVTSFLIILGGIGFLVIKDVLEKKNFKKLTLHSKIVIKTTLILIFGGTIILKLTQNITWLGAFFASVSARTAGFVTYPFDVFNRFGLLFITILMFIGASPSSTGGGIKTTTIYTLLKGTYSTCVNDHCFSFKRLITPEIINRSFIVLFLATMVVACSTTLLCVFEPNIDLSKLLFESVSAFATVGSSLGITPILSSISKLILMITMFIGRVGPLTLLSVWTKKNKKNIIYPKENIIIG